jgi:formylmethanofuran--tetrahydromethanopterin N-formyltransferase
MQISGVEIEDTFAEAFDMYAARVQVTAVSDKWAETAAQEATGFATSIIECGCEAGIEEKASPEETVDGRPGYNLIFAAMDKENLEDQLTKRVGQAIMTSPTSACFDLLPDTEEEIQVGGKLRYFGDGYQISKLYDERRFWRVPVMDGEFLVAETFGVTDSVGGGNFLVIGKTQRQVLSAAEEAAAVINDLAGVIAPFPGGIVRSGSKVGSKYDFLSASTNSKYCPLIKNQVESNLSREDNAVLEIVIDGLSYEATAAAIAKGIKAACGPGVNRISAGNYGGDLGAHIFNLHEVLRGEE